MGRSQDQRGGHSPASQDMSAEGFAARFVEVYPVLWVVAAGVTGQPSLADDVVHEAAVQAVGKLEQYRPGTSFKAWMTQIVRYVALNQARAHRKHKAVPLDRLDGAEEIATDPRRSVGPVHLTDTGQLTKDQPHFDDELISALQLLTETARACLLLRTVQGLSYQEIAEVLGIPDGTAMSHVHRSRRVLRKQLERRAAGNRNGRKPQS